MPFRNSYEDNQMASAYAKLEFPGTYYLAFRDLPEIILTHARGGLALDFGCGTGRSSRFLKSQGFAVTGIDISREMINHAQMLDEDGDYRLVKDTDLSALNGTTFDLVLCAFTFDNIPTMERKVALLRAIRGCLKKGGVIINLISSPDIYLNEWASFSTKDFPKNRCAKSGEKVRIIVTDIEDRTPVEDVLWPDNLYQETYRRAGLLSVKSFRPLAHEDEPFQWINETRIAPWVIYVLKADQGRLNSF